MTEAMADHGCDRHSDYGLTCESFDRLRERAGGACELCRLKPWLVVDHDHRLGNTFPRGLLCAGCNVRIGQVDRGTRVATTAQAAYLTNPWHLLNPSTITPRTPRPNMVLKAFRLPPELWAKVVEKCDRLQINPSDAVRAALTRWVNED